MLERTTASWQDAAAYAVNQINQYAHGPILKDGKRDALRHHLDVLIGELDIIDRLFPISWREEFRRLGATAYWAAVNENYPVRLDDDLVALLARKQHDYGPENILRFGNRGLLVRLHDKVARLENLLSQRDG